VLNALLRYEADTGILYWKPRPASAFASIKAWQCWKNKCSDKPAGAIKRRKDGKTKSVVVRVFNILRPAHRLIWIMRNGPIPPGIQVDHKNLNPLDNSLTNLRLATHAQNQQNTRQRGNPTGFKGVVPTGRRFVAKMVRGGRQIHIGTFDTPEQANAAYYRAAQKADGEFARG
jgi:hypothetical protein